MTELSKASMIPEPALQEVFDRGIGAWKTNISSVRLQKDFSKNPNTKKYPRSARLGKEQWALARVYSFIDRGKTYQTADNDIAQKYNIERTKNINTKYKMPKPRGGAMFGQYPAVNTLYDEADAFQRAITNDNMTSERRKATLSNNKNAMASALAENQVADVKLLNEVKQGGSHKSQHIKYMLGHLKERNKGYVKPFEPFRPNMVKNVANSPFIKNLQKAHSAPKAPAKRKAKAEPVAEEAPAPAPASAPVDKKARAVALKAEGLSTRAIAKKLVEEGYTKVSPSTVVNLLKGSGIKEMVEEYRENQRPKYHAMGGSFMGDLFSRKSNKQMMEEKGIPSNSFTRWISGTGYDEHPEDFFF
jgi:rhodanese-related sulfurtransferase